MKITFEPYGAQRRLTFSGKPDEVARTVNLFANHGMYGGEAVPSTYKEDEDDTVVVYATAKRIPLAIQSLVETEMIKDGRSKQYKGKPALFQSAAAEIAAARIAEWERVRETKPVEDSRDLSAQRNDDEGADITPALRAEGRRIIDMYFGRTKKD